MLKKLVSTLCTAESKYPTTIYFSSYFLAGKKMASKDDVQKSYLSGRWRDIMLPVLLHF